MKETTRHIKKIRITQKITEMFSDIENGYVNVGFTTISLSPVDSINKPTRHILGIEHSGNMGNSIKHSVNPNLKRIGFPTIEELRDIYEVIEERGSPDYYYSIEFDFYINKPKN